jgi:hypothetical protein
MAWLAIARSRPVLPMIERRSHDYTRPGQASTPACAFEADIWCQLGNASQ